MHVLAAPDKFRGSASAPDVAASIARAVHAAGGSCTELPLADGGEGTLDAFGGTDRDTLVTGPLGTELRAAWRLDADRRAVIEMALAAGLELAGGPERNNPVTATTRGVGELVAASLRAGARKVVIGVGGSATTDGGLGAVEALEGFAPLNDPGSTTEVLVCCDVRTRFTDAARVFGPQKGASPEQVAKLTERLQRLQDRYRQRYGIDISHVPGAGAAGGLAGGLAVLGARLVPGFDLIADEVGLDRALAEADLVVTGEGQLDTGSFDGKVVGGVIRAARARSVPALAVAGSVRPDVDNAVPAVSLLHEYGSTAAWTSTTECVRRAITTHLNRKEQGDDR